MGERVCDWFECDGEGYPEDDSLQKLMAFDMTPQQAARFVVYDFPEICEQISCCHCAVSDAEDWDGKPKKMVRFTTGGWSGAEDLIGAMLGHFWIKHLHFRWERGGLFEFEVPNHLLAAPTPRSPQ